MGRPRKVDVRGERFNFLVVEGWSVDYSTNKKWACRCDCGNLLETTLQRLRSGRAKSCGCKKSELLSKAFTTHGAAGNGENSPAYQSYVAMMHRCYDDTRNTWESYGGRGIFVEDQRWLECSPYGFLNFLEDMGERPKCTSLDRIDVNKGYSKENCRWANASTQAYNSRRSKTPKNTSKYRGVSFCKDGRQRPWVARIGNGKGGYTRIGQFATEEDAAIAYNKKAIEIHGNDAILNIIAEEYEKL